MTLGKREYSDADMIRMQRLAEERVREMQNRARAAVENDNANAPPNRNRNWSTGQSMRRQNRGRPQSRPEHANPPQPAPPPKEPPREETQPQPHENEKPVEQKESTTIIEDVMDALGLDEDYLLIIGLMLILINQRADTTLILALAYLLI